MDAFTIIATITGPALQLALAIVMLRRNLYRQFPFFFAYTLFSIAVIGPRIAANRNPALFFLVYTVTEIIFGLLGLLVIREVFRFELETISQQHRRFRFLPVLILLLITLIALWRAAYHPPGHILLARLSAGAYAFMLGVHIVQIAALLLLVEVERRTPLTVPWHERAILEGFGLSAAVYLLAYLLRIWLGPRVDDWFVYLQPGGYFMATVIWLTAFCRRFPPPKTVDTQRIDRAIKFFQRRTRAIRRLNKSLSASP